MTAVCNQERLRRKINIPVSVSAHAIVINLKMFKLFLIHITYLLIRDVGTQYNGSLTHVKIINLKKGFVRIFVNYSIKRERAGTASLKRLQQCTMYGTLYRYTICTVVNHFSIKC